MQLTPGTHHDHPPRPRQCQSPRRLHGRKAQIDVMLERLKALSDDHFETHPDEINWGHVGTLNHYASLLRQITDAAFKEGEHAT